MKWSDEAWREAEPVYQAIVRHPFVCELAEGRLSRERFEFYIAQDAVYIDNYSRVLAHIASRLDDKAMTADFLRFATEGIEVEKALHESYLKGGGRRAEATPACLLYTSYETSMALAPVEVEAAAILPCFEVYRRVGESIIQRSTPDNPYCRWIATYGDPVFAAGSARAVEICDTLAREATASVGRRMTEAFVAATRMEWMFWDSAYRMEKWKI